MWLCNILLGLSSSLILDSWDHLEEFYGTSHTTELDYELTLGSLRLCFVPPVSCLDVTLLQSLQSSEPHELCLFFWRHAYNMDMFFLYMYFVNYHSGVSVIIPLHQNILALHVNVTTYYINHLKHLFMIFLCLGLISCTMTRNMELYTNL